MISMIFASARNGVIGRDGKLPWRLSEDLRRFKRLTTGGVVVMGRRTWEGLPKKLRWRTPIVLTRDGNAPDYFTLPEALNYINAWHATDAVFVAGGADIFRLFLPVVARIHWTRIDADVDGDTIFDFRPDEDNGWKMIASEDVPADAENEYKSTYMIFDRK